MFLYRIEAQWEDRLQAVAIVAAETDEAAFEYAEQFLEKHYLVLPKLDELSIVEKKRLNKGSGYIIETNSPS